MANCNIVLYLLIVAVVIEMQKQLKIVAWNANGLCNRWNYLDVIRQKHDITFVSEHKMFNCELFKLNDDANYKVHACASRSLPDDKFGSYFGHGGVAMYWHIKDDHAIKILSHLCNDRMITLQYNEGNENIFVIGVYLPQQRCQVSLNM